MVIRKRRAARSMREQFTEACKECATHTVSLALGYTIAIVASHSLASEKPETINLKDRDGNIVWAHEVEIRRKDNGERVGICVNGSQEPLDPGSVYRVDGAIIRSLTGLPRRD